MVLVNSSGTLGMVIVEFTNNVTGSFFLTGLLALTLLLALFLLFNIPFEASIILVLPFILVLMAYNSNFLAVGGLALIYLAVLFVRMFFGRP